ncbi:MAG TPA: hypothetical protein VH518_24615 [Tepidisphaeraceae bacterium]|jgi:hypothetical protein
MTSPQNFRSLSLAGLLITVLAAVAVGADEEMVDNPYYQYWRNHKPGASVVHQETTKITSADTTVPNQEATDEKKVAWKLLDVDDTKAVVEMVVTEKEPLGYVQSAPNRYIYPAKVAKSELGHEMQMSGAKTGEDVVKFQDKDLKVKTLEGSCKAADGSDINYKVWLSDQIPGSVVKKVQTTRQNGNVVAETTVTALSYKTSD